MTSATEQRELDAFADGETAETDLAERVDHNTEDIEQLKKMLERTTDHIERLTDAVGTDGTGESGRRYRRDRGARTPPGVPIVHERHRHRHRRGRRLVSRWLSVRDRGERGACGRPRGSRPSSPAAGPARALVRRSGRRARFAHQHAHETTSSLLAVRRRLPRVSATDTPGTHGWTDVRVPRHAVASARSHRRVDVRFSGRVSRFAPRNVVALPTVRSVFARASASFAAANDREPAVVPRSSPDPRTRACWRSRWALSPGGDREYSRAVCRHNPPTKVMSRRARRDWSLVRYACRGDGSGCANTGSDRRSTAAGVD